MTEGLVAGLTEQQLCDLIEYYYRCGREMQFWADKHRLRHWPHRQIRPRNGTTKAAHGIIPGAAF